MTTPLDGSGPLASDLVEAYRVLLDGPLNASEFAQALSCPVSESNETLNRLEHLRLIRRSLKDPCQWETVAPGAAIAAIVAPIQARAHQLTQRSETVRKALSSLESMYQSAYRKQFAQSSIELVRGGERVRQRLSDLASQAQDTVFAIHPTMAPIEVLRAGLELDRSLLERGVTHHVVWPHSARRQPESVEYMRLLQELGGSVRTAAMLPSRMILLDCSVALVPLPKEEGAGAGIIRDPVVLEFLRRIFEHIWERAQPVIEISYDETVFGEIELAILTDLAQGRTDEVIARRLGISTRTLRRYLTALFERLGVDTRFQLGIAAMRAGLIRDEYE